MPQRTPRALAQETDTMPTISSLRSWLRHSRRRPRNALAAARPQVEALEPRAVPTTITVGPNVNTGHMAGNQGTEAIAIDPANSRMLFAAATDFAAGGNGLYVARSTDGGKSWTSRVAAGGSDGLPTAIREPSLAWDGFGNLFMSYIDTSTTNFTLALSTDGGATFRALGSFPVIDQPHLAVGAGEVAVSYEAPFGSFTDIEVSSARVTGLGAVGRFATVHVPNSIVGDFGSIAIEPGGAIVVSFEPSLVTAGPVNIMVSTDPKGVGGAFNNPVTATSTNVGVPDTIPAQSANGIEAQSVLAADLSNGPHRGRLYLIYTDAPTVGSNDTNVFVRHSDNNGATWSAPVRVNDDRGANSQFFGYGAVDPRSGFLAVAWYDSRNSATNTQTQVFATVSSDGGASFLPNVRVSTGFSDTTINHNKNSDYGDYIGLAFFNGTFFPCWADNGTTLSGNADRPNFDIATAQCTVPIPTSPPSPPGPGSPVPKILYPFRYVFDPLAQTYSGDLTLMNIGGGLLSGPATFVFTALPPGVTLVNATGRLNGFPVIKVFFAPLGPGQSVRVHLVFTDPLNIDLGSFFQGFPVQLILG
jgi:hypothetical protein